MFSREESSCSIEESRLCIYNSRLTIQVPSAPYKNIHHFKCKTSSVSIQHSSVLMKYSSTLSESQRLRSSIKIAATLLPLLLRQRYYHCYKNSCLIYNSLPKQLTTNAPLCTGGPPISAPIVES